MIKVHIKNGRLSSICCHIFTYLLYKWPGRERLFKVANSALVLNVRYAKLQQIFHTNFLDCFTIKALLKNEGFRSNEMVEGF